MRDVHGPKCTYSGFTIVLQECTYHGGFDLLVYKHESSRSVDELPLVMSDSFGSIDGGHEFYDTVVEVVSDLLAQMSSVD
jgi:hypothetical protein